MREAKTRERVAKRAKRVRALGVVRLGGGEREPSECVASEATGLEWNPLERREPTGVIRKPGR